MEYKDTIVDSTIKMLQTTRCGFLTSQHVTSVVDEIITQEFINHAHDDIALLAIGGYGRRELAPFSDVDLMFLCNKKDQSVSETIEKILYSLWDIGMGISHSVRTIQETIQDASADLQTRTALLDSRLICGSSKIWNEYRREVYPKIVRSKKEVFISSLLSEVSRRYKTYSLSLYQLEPNIKEGRGGLRDMHTIQWLLKVSSNLERFEDIKGFLPSLDFKQFKRACEFILRSRICLHIVSDRKNELLSFDYQDKVATMMGFKKTQRFSASEIFLRVYYRHTRMVMETLNRISRLCAKKMFRFFPTFLKKQITQNYFLFNNEIVMKDTTLLSRPDVLIEAFLSYAISRRDFSINLENEIKRVVRRLKRTRQVAVIMSNIFLKILQTTRVYETLYEMHRLAVLEIVIPEFKGLRYLVVHEPYHRYTVDEHTLRCIKHLENIKNGINTRYKVLQDITKELDIRPIYIALLLHDVGKGVFGSRLRHEGEGYKIIKGTLEMFALTRQEKCLIEFLVMNHLVLSRDALKRDIEDPNTVFWLTDIVQDELRLKALLLTTFADMSAVKPDFFSEWKAQILFDLYSMALSKIRGVDRVSIKSDSDEIRRFLSLMPERYEISTSLDDINKDFSLFKIANIKGIAIDIRNTNTDIVEVVVSTYDSKGLFLKIVEVISSFGLNIVKARLYPVKNSMIIDKIYISNWQYVAWDGFEQNFVEDLTKSIVSEMRIGKPDAGLRKTNEYAVKRHLMNFEPFVELDNEISDNNTMIELFASDRVGLLFDISKILVAFDVDIISAIINTDGDIAHDVFYVQHRGEKILNSNAIRLMKSIYDVVG
ncbi:MAG: [protein-PII] uridylyltransferase [Thermodesulfovibrionales bacterium]|nr:[protein-PII] uridylyltransferase [Thermodesulfovibrionales bacterium]